MPDHKASLPGWIRSTSGCPDRWPGEAWSRLRSRWMGKPPTILLCPLNKNKSEDSFMAKRVTALYFCVLTWACAAHGQMLSFIHQITAPDASEVSMAISASRTGTYAAGVIQA